MHWYLMLAAAGFVAGVVNTIAGGGSFLTLPALMLFGLDPKIANGTNRVAILLSSGAAVATFQRQGMVDPAMVRRLVPPTILGVPIGAGLAIYLPGEAFQPVFGMLFLGMAVLLLLNPKRLLESDRKKELSSKVIWPVFMGIGVYVGFIQAGMGILLLLAMSFLNTGDLLASNVIKNWIGFLVTLVAVLLFVATGYVEWAPGLAMASGNLLGGIAGAKLAIKRGNRLIFAFLIIVMIATGTKLLFAGGF
ncbi:hypothetical protein FF011L_48010 [Roseimaritima multifibrata]|uniref:Probable membrane transporter protein n=1 Tax=Roseimaritima multifibrata TaxID=1930274 RepID=A0A517MMJ0_9BACT|nr:sulfite exporter TauE/SafE family protein [Roseimaritima multifibrata]QDS95997.1 hypothetical protein FF011L_48010 [Roseimaritima multifibrata]